MSLGKQSFDDDKVCFHVSTEIEKETKRRGRTLEFWHTGQSIEVKTRKPRAGVSFKAQRGTIRMKC